MTEKIQSELRQEEGEVNGGSNATTVNNAEIREALKKYVMEDGRVMRYMWSKDQYSKPEPLTWEKFEEIMLDPAVQQVCDDL